VESAFVEQRTLDVKSLAVSVVDLDSKQEAFRGKMEISRAVIHALLMAL
jgi:hypothetical protein